LSSHGAMAKFPSISTENANTEWPKHQDSEQNYLDQILRPTKYQDQSPKMLQILCPGQRLCETIHIP
jgi:hypothetical protein